MELTELLNAGGVAGLVSSAISSVLIFLFAHRQAAKNSTAENLNTEHPLIREQRILMLFAHLALGVALGFVFWISWGFTALVGVAWWQRGIVFALLTYLICAVPLIGALRSTLRTRASLSAAIASQWFLTFLLAGLACAWSWGHRH